MAELSSAIAILRNRTDLVCVGKTPEARNLAAIWEAIDIPVDAIERPARGAPYLPETRRRG